MGIRELVFAALIGDAQLNALGITTDTLWENNAPDSAPADVFGVLRWGVGNAPLPGADKRVTATEVALWAYDRNQDYGKVLQINKRWCIIMESLVGQSTGDGYVLGISDPTDGPDAWDDIYERVTRPSSYTIVHTS